MSTENTQSVRWNPAQKRLERKVAGDWEPFPPPTDLQGVAFVTCQQRPMLHITRIATGAREASARLPQARPHERTNLRMAIQAWNLTWRCLKRNRPETAALLQSEPLQEIVAAFDGEIRIPLEEES